MSFVKARGRADDALPPSDSLLCKANGCNQRGSVDLGGGFACGIHAFSESHDWPRITEGLHGHGWLIEFMRDIRRIDLHSKEWRNYATTFWEEADTFMVPASHETRDNYLYRLHLELQWRCGARDRRPEPFKVKILPGRYGNLAGIIAGQGV